MHMHDHCNCRTILTCKVKLTNRSTKAVYSEKVCSTAMNCFTSSSAYSEHSITTPYYPMPCPLPIQSSYASRPNLHPVVDSHIIAQAKATVSYYSQLILALNLPQVQGVLEKAMEVPIKYIEMFSKYQSLITREVYTLTELTTLLWCAHCRLMKR